MKELESPGKVKKREKGSRNGVVIRKPERESETALGRTEPSWAGATVQTSESGLDVLRLWTSRAVGKQTLSFLCGLGGSCISYVNAPALPRKRPDSPHPFRVSLPGDQRHFRQSRRVLGSPAPSQWAALIGPFEMCPAQAHLGSSSRRPAPLSAALRAPRPGSRGAPLRPSVPARPPRPARRPACASGQRGACCHDEAGVSTGPGAGRGDGAGVSSRRGSYRLHGVGRGAETRPGRTAPSRGGGEACATPPVPVAGRPAPGSGPPPPGLSEVAPFPPGRPRSQAAFGRVSAGCVVGGVEC